MIHTDGRPTIANNYPGRVIYTETRRAWDRVDALEKQLKRLTAENAGLRRELERVR